MNAMTDICRLVVSTGPERGKVFEPEEELVHIGRGPENQIILDDPSLEGHHASLLRKNGRYAIYRSEEADVRVDGSEIPSEKWIWLPAEVRLQFGRRTACQFSYDEPLIENDDAPPTESQVMAAAATVAPRAAPERQSTPEKPAGGEESKERAPAKPEARKKKKTKRKSRNVARFITDRGDTLVELGGDGQLPELTLEDGPTAKQRDAKPKKSSPAILYCVLGLSFMASMSILLLDLNPKSGSETSKAEARIEIMRFYGIDEDELVRTQQEMSSNPQQRWPWSSGKTPLKLLGANEEPSMWQKNLRRARLAASRGDRAEELRSYRRVLSMLNSEDRNPHIGVTGHLNSDQELRDLIRIIISR